MRLPISSINFKQVFTVSVTLILIGCASTTATYPVPAARLATDVTQQEQISDESSSVDDTQEPAQFTSLQALSRNNSYLQQQATLASKFSDNDQLQLSAEQLPGAEFIHTVFGELLGVSYVLSEEIKNLKQPVTLNIQSAMTSQQLFVLTTKLLAERNIEVTESDGVYFISSLDPKNKGNTTIGFGKKPSDVPQVNGQIVQIVPMRYGISPGFERTLRDLTDARISPDLEQSAVYITADRSEILRVLDLIELLDTPTSRGKNIGILKLVYITPDEFMKKVAVLLDSEGLPADINRPGKRNLVMVSLEQLGAVALFAADELYLERVNFWAKQLDQPGQGVENRYFIFHPRFARASDLASSVAALLGQSLGAANRSGNRSRDTRSAVNSNETDGATSARAQQGTLNISNDKMTLTVDERSNSLIFYTTGKEYQALLPLIKRLDVMPKQILLETTIAEVTMTDDFKMGLEFAINNGSLKYGTSGAFSVGKIGGFSLSYVNGLDKIIANLVATDSRVNVLSNPSIVVRDGITATISVGSDIPTVGSTTFNPNTDSQTTTTVYRKTGVNLSVTPTISAQGLVVMEINQNISNQVEGSTLTGSPSIFERSIQTEVIAQNGQTVLLGGLISENTSSGNTKVPFLGDIPILGALFKSKTKTSSKTELVIMITPKVLDNPQQWQQLRNKLSEGLEFLQLDIEKP